MNKYQHTCIIALLFLWFPLIALDLELEQTDLAVVQDPNGAGYHFYIKKKPDIASVLITETTKDPSKRLDNFAYRAPEYNEINGNEKRILNGKELQNNAKNLYSLVDSTPDPNTIIGEAFHIWVPYIVVYGYSWSRNGEVQVLDGTFFNIRTFEKPYADYAGSFSDNPFVLRVTQKHIKDNKPETFSNMAIDSFSKLSRISGNKLIYADTVDTIIPAIEVILHPQKCKTLEAVFVIDATESMRNDIEKIRLSLESSLEPLLSRYDSFRIALVLYKDYNDDFLVKTAHPFTSNIKEFMSSLNSFHVAGGRDIPEAVYEGIDAGLNLDWGTDTDTDRRLILIGDAPPHPHPQGTVTQESVIQKAQEKDIKLFSIILPHGSTF